MEPAIWRRIQVREDTKLPRLHRILPMLIHRKDYHLHDLVVGRRVYNVPDPDDGFNRRKVIDEKGVALPRRQKPLRMTGPLSSGSGRAANSPPE